MGSNLKLASLVFGFLLYILDVGSDVYVAIKFYKNGETEYFIVAVAFVSIPVIIVNIFATWSLRNKYKIIKGILCLTHLSMVQLFIEELCQWRRDKNEHSHNGKHFSKCECLNCKRRFQEKTKSSKEYKAVRYMETFVESAPQLCFQVMVMRRNGGPYPWYAIASIVLSLLSMLWSIFCLEKAYWINQRVEQNLKPANYPKSSAIVFLLWQTLLLPARCFTIVILPNFFTVLGLVAFHYSVISFVIIGYFPSCSCSRCIVRISSLMTSFPWHFHVSTSGLEVPNAYFHNDDGVARLRKFIKVALVLIPVLFMLEATIVILYLADLPNSVKYNWLGGVCGAILVATVVSLFYYTCCHPATRNVQVGVERGIINVVPINDHG